MAFPEDVTAVHSSFNFFFFFFCFSLRSMLKCHVSISKEIGSELMWSLGWAFFSPPPFFLSDIIAGARQSGRTDRVWDCVDTFFKTLENLSVIVIIFPRRFTPIQPFEYPVATRQPRWSACFPTLAKRIAWASLALSLLLMI